MDLSDAHLGRRLAAGDRSAIASLYDRHGALCYRAAVVACGSKTLAEDALQEVFMRITSDPRGLSTAANVAGYLLRMVQHAAIDLRRREERRAATGVSESEAKPTTADAERDHQVAQALAALPEAQRNVVILRIWEEHSLEETGRLLGISPNTAASRWRYAMVKLAGLLKGHHDA